MPDAPYFQQERFQLHAGKRRYLEFLVDLVRRESIAPPASLLEIGSGTGLFAMVAEEAGYSITGVEAASYAAAEAQKRVRGPILCRDANQRLDLPSHSFDAVVMWDVIEHLHDVATTLDEARRLLRPGGKIFVITLNAGSIVRPILGRRWAWYQDPTHVFLFSIRTLRAAIRDAGFSDIRMSTILNFHSAGESFAPLRPFRRLGGVLRIPWGGDSLLAIGTV